MKNMTYLYVTYGDAADTVTISADDYKLCHNTLPGLYDIEFLVYSNRNTPIEKKLLAVLNDIANGVAKSAYFTVYDYYRDKTRKYVMIGVPDITIGKSEIILKATCTETLANYAPYSYNRPIPNIVEIIFNNPATIVYWSDDTKTVVKACDKDTFDKEVGLAMAIAKKAIATNSVQNPRACFKHLVKSAKDYSDYANI